MAFVEQIDDAEATGPLRRIYDAARQRAGGVANIIRVMSLDAPSAQTSLGLYASLMKRDNALDASRRELLATVVSNVNECYY